LGTKHTVSKPVLSRQVNPPETDLNRPVFLPKRSVFSLSAIGYISQNPFAEEVLMTQPSPSAASPARSAFMERVPRPPAFAIPSRIHAARPDVVAAAHAHSLYGKAWSSLGRRLDPLTQDACAFYEDHVVFDDYSGVVEEPSEGDRIARALGAKKAAILRNHG